MKLTPEEVAYLEANEDRLTPGEAYLLAQHRLSTSWANLKAEWRKVFFSLATWVQVAGIGCVFQGGIHIGHKHEALGFALMVVGCVLVNMANSLDRRAWSREQSRK